jgi:Chaperone of endosialidase
MAVPYTFGTATSAIPLSQLDADFATPITIGNTAVQLGNTVTTLNNMTLANVTITSGTANVSANVTYSNANAVVYTNGSNVGVTSTALTFDGTTLNNSGAFGSSTAAFTLKNTSSASTSNIVEQQFWAGNTFSGLVSIAAFGADTSIGVGNQYGSFYWKIANAGAPTEQMRLTSTGLGIGTSSPAVRLNVTDSADGSNSGTIRLGSDGTYYGQEQFRYNSSEYRFGVYPSGNMTFYTKGSESARIDSSGNFYIEVAATTASAANMFLDTTTTPSGQVKRSTSALKYKKDIRDLEEININKIRPVRYKSKCEGDDQTKDHFGVIADEVDAAGIKELVTYGANGEVEGFQYERLTVVLLKAIQTLKAEFDAYKASHP